MSAFTLAAAACGGDDDDDAGSTDTEAVADTDAVSTDTEATSETDAPAETDAPSETDAPPSTEEGDEGGETPGTSPGESHVTEDEGEPVQGGDLVYGIEADTANPWAPYRTSCATAGYVLLTSLSDPLFTATPDGEIAPVLVESYEPNADYTQWTLHIRDGITFHDGTPLDGAAVEFNMETCQYCAADRRRARRRSRTSVVGPGRDDHDQRALGRACPRCFTERQCAYMLSPTVARQPGGRAAAHRGHADLRRRRWPRRRPTAIRRSRSASARSCSSRTRRATATRSGRCATRTTGAARTASPARSLPYLDAIEAVAAVDIDSRSNALRSGQFDIIHTSNSRHASPVPRRRRVRDHRRRACSATPTTSC